MRWLVITFLVWILYAIWALLQSQAQFTEHLHITPFRDGSILSHWQFVIEASWYELDEYILFPKSLGQILQRFGVESMHLALTSGRWRHQWEAYPLDFEVVAASKIQSEDSSSMLSSPIAPIGAQVWTRFYQNHFYNTSFDKLTVHKSTKPKNRETLNDRWEGLLSYLAGTFCGSLNRIKREQTTRPSFLFDSPRLSSNNTHETISNPFYGVLPRENVCTENLTPLSKLLPCRTSSGLAKLIHSERLFDSTYHSLQVHYTPIHCASEDLNNIRNACGARLLMTVSMVTPPALSNPSKRSEPDSVKSLYGEEDISACPLAIQSKTVVHTREEAFFPRTPSGITQLLSDYRMNFGRSASSVLGLQSHRYLTERDAQWSYLHLQIWNDGNHTLSIQYFDHLPWFTRVYFHTLNIEIKSMKDANIKLNDNSLWNITQFQPAGYRSSPAQWEMEFTLPPGTMLHFSVEIEKLLLTVNNDYPPDASRGFDLPAAILNVRSDLNSSIIYQLYTESLLVLLPFPDQSMPFNVIAFTSTLAALFFGSLFHILHDSDVDILERRNRSFSKRLQERLQAFRTKFKR